MSIAPASKSPGGVSIPAVTGEERKVLLNKVNLVLAKVGKFGHADTGNVWLKKDGNMNEALFTDGLSPRPAGYKALRKLLEKEINKLKR